MNLIFSRSQIFIIFVLYWAYPILANRILPSGYSSSCFYHIAVNISIIAFSLSQRHLFAPFHLRPYKALQYFTACCVISSFFGLITSKNQSEFLYSLSSLSAFAAIPALFSIFSRSYSKISFAIVNLQVNAISLILLVGYVLGKYLNYKNYGYISQESWLDYTLTERSGNTFGTNYVTGLLFVPASVNPSFLSVSVFLFVGLSSLSRAFIIQVIFIFLILFVKAVINLVVKLKVSSLRTLIARFLLFSAVAVLALALFSYISQNTSSLGVLRSFNLDISSLFADDRFFISQVAITSIISSPLSLFFGNPAGSFADLSASVLGLPFSDPHNILLSLAYTNGLISCAFLLYLFLFILKSTLFGSFNRKLGFVSFALVLSFFLYSLSNLSLLNYSGAFDQQPLVLFALLLSYSSVCYNSPNT